jgi:hypothetical protein
VYERDSLTGEPIYYLAKKYVDCISGTQITKESRAARRREHASRQQGKTETLN